MLIPYVITMIAILTCASIGFATKQDRFFWVALICAVLAVYSAIEFHPC